MTPIRYDALTALIHSRAPACGTTKVVAVDGPSGAGKTELARGLAAVLHAPVLHLDEVYPGWSGLAATPQLVRDYVLAPLAVSELGRIARWDWLHDRPGEPVVVAPTPLLIIDGVGSGALACRPFLSVLLWVDAPPAQRKARALSRDAQTYAPFWELWAAQERRLYSSDAIRQSADLVIDTSTDGILVAEAEPPDRGAGNG